MSEPNRATSPLVDYAKSLDCIHCGLCLQTCPTFRLTGNEASSPRGRIHLMRAVGEGRLEPDAAFTDEMEFCLLCRHCESVCPAGVQFGALMEHTRGALSTRQVHSWPARLARWFGLRGLLPHRLALRTAGSLVRATQLLRLDRLADRILPGRGFAFLPRVPPLRARRLLPRRIGDAAPCARLFLLEGCVMPEFHAHVNRATAGSLAKLGFALEVPAVTCCGSLHAHNGDLVEARVLARRLIEACEALSGPGEAPLLVTNSAGCGAHLKELAHLFAAHDPWHARAAALAGRVRDYSEVVAGALAEKPGLRGIPDLPQPIAWDDPCHLCHAQKIRQEPRAVLGAIPGLSQVELPESESCCGSAGIYSLLRPEASQAVFARKREALERCGARTLVTANTGCQMQWESGLARAGSRVRVVHLAEIVNAALEAPRATD